MEALSLFTSAGSMLKSKGLARGGPVLPGGMYTVGENGPETLFVGRSGGIVVPNGVGMMAGGGGSSINASVTINNPVVRSDADIRSLADRVSAAQASQLRGFGVRS